MGQLDGKVAFITGAARGQGRSHAVLLAEEGADIIGLDICEQINSVVPPMSTQADLDETVALVEKTGRRMIGVKGDVRNRADIQRALDLGLAEFGRLDIVLANAGIFAVNLQLRPAVGAGVAGQSRRHPHRDLEHASARLAHPGRAG